MQERSTASAQAPAAAWFAGLAILVTTALTGLISARASAETIVVDDQVSVVASNVNRPRRGMTMKAVEARFGAPPQRQPAVGKPPITRWDYPDFTVFFEHEYVIDTVVKAGY